MDTKILETPWGKIRTTTEDDVVWYAVCDIFQRINGKRLQTSPSVRTYSSLINIKKFEMDTIGVRSCNFIDRNSLEILMLKTEDIKLRRYAPYFDIALPEMRMKISKEKKYLDIIEKSFPSGTFQRQTKIMDYRVDMYSEKFKIIIECDEFGHVDRDEKYESERTQKISEYFKNAKWIRFNPDEKDFDIIDIIREIVTIIMERIVL